MTTPVAQRLPGRTLISNELFARLAQRIVADEGYDQHLAERIVDQALVFLKACATNEGPPLSPSSLVDVGWHTFVLYTKEYADFCRREAGRFIHHVPDDSPGAPQHTPHVRTHTLAAIERAGFAVDPDLWAVTDGKCGQCHEDGNCSASGADGNENTDHRG